MHLKLKKRIPFFVTAALLVSACPYNQLEGSIDGTLALDFTEVRIRKQDDDLLLEYLRESERGSEKVCKVVIDTAGLELPAEGASEIVDEDFLSRVNLHRSTFDNDAFPPMVSGKIHFDELGFKDDGKARGNFEILFEASRSLRGWFDGFIEEI